MSTPLWVPLVVAVVGVGGTLAGSILTQLQASRREERRWQQEREREQDVFERQRQYERDRWLRDKRHETYSHLIQESRRFAGELMPTIDMLQRLDDPKANLYEARHRYFELLYQASFLAGEVLQKQISLARDVAEDAGHEPYHTAEDKRKFERELLERAFNAWRSLEDAAREELGLPARHRDND
jgi:hypothetical protein